MFYRQNKIIENDQDTGDTAIQADCKCPDGQTYVVGNKNGSMDFNCDNGVAVDNSVLTKITTKVECKLYDEDLYTYYHYKSAKDNFIAKFDFLDLSDNPETIDQINALNYLILEPQTQLQIYFGQTDLETDDPHQTKTFFVSFTMKKNQEDLLTVDSDYFYASSVLP